METSRPLQRRCAGLATKRLSGFYSKKASSTRHRPRRKSTRHEERPLISGDDALVVERSSVLDVVDGGMIADSRCNDVNKMGKQKNSSRNSSNCRQVEDGREGEEENENFMDSLNEVKDSGKAFDVRSSPPEEEVNWFTTAQQQAKMLMEDVKPSLMVKASPVTGIQCVEFGGNEIQTWYSSPYPSEYQHLRRISICEFCFEYKKCSVSLQRHMVRCNQRHPPGIEIYRKGVISVFEVDGAVSTAYCQKLCLFAKLFLDHKTLYYEVEPFLFYIMTEADSSGCHVVGYFSKEKESALRYNLSCILTLPQHMRKGYGKMLIEFSYLLSKMEDKVGSPEKPLSDLGLLTYRSYWKGVLLDFLLDYKRPTISVKDLSSETAICQYDIISTLQSLGMLKYWKGKHIVLRCPELLKDHRRKRLSKAKHCQLIDPKCLRWSPLDKEA
ncbi:histone acetyltransferase KAT7-like [Corticium candelabrum]|uniref:histone acetyltransferase KAT7-like n=1 Tax=Corticium candelabrum TaxID=121492 RepID=UPI002E26C54C|nr:histone acetyltransferase KAT7-like [Corticium candelabrum]